eukprot:CCRYP_018347-RA/>CCRYP_018347-RA protein AED:0.48 eAED:0.48 QI:0/0.5/0.66/0.66/0.5/0.33/3/147/65
MTHILQITSCKLQDHLLGLFLVSILGLIYDFIRPGTGEQLKLSLQTEFGISPCTAVLPTTFGQGM